MVTFIPRRKEEKNPEETKPIFESSYLGNALCDLVEIGMRGTDGGVQKSSGFIQAT